MRRVPKEKEGASTTPQPSQDPIALDDPISIRRATPADADPCGRICFEAFGTLAARHNFPSDIPQPASAVALLSTFFSHPSFFCIVAERGGKIIGSNCLDERTPIAGVGPITIDSATQNRTAGRQLMHAVMVRAAEKKCAGIRLVQAAYHNRSLALYAKLGFIVREPLACMQGPALRETLPGYRIRPAETSDLAACDDLCFRVHGHDRAGELRDAIQHGTAVVAEFHGQVKSYATILGFLGHAIAQTNRDLQALIAASDGFQGAGILVPTRNAELFRWCLSAGLRIVQPMTLMTIGFYNEPAGSYLPSVLF